MRISDRIPSVVLLLSLELILLAVYEDMFDGEPTVIAFVPDSWSVVIRCLWVTRQCPNLNIRKIILFLRTSAGVFEVCIVV